MVRRWKNTLSGKSFLASDDLQQTNYREIRVQVTDDDGQSSELSFQVVQQDELDSESNSGSILASTVSLLFIFSIAVLVYMRQRNNPNQTQALQNGLNGAKAKELIKEL